MKTQSARMSGSPVLAQAGSCSDAPGLDRRSSSSNPDSLIPSRIAFLASQYSNAQNIPNTSACTSTKTSPIPPIDICGSPDVVGHGTACTPPGENSKPSGASDGADGRGVCTLTLVLFGAHSSVRLCTAYADSLAYMGKCRGRQKSVDSVAWSAYYWAADVLRDQLRLQVERVRDMGLLLHVGCAV